jgi:hypothetical protein
MLAVLILCDWVQRDAVFSPSSSRRGWCIIVTGRRAVQTTFFHVVFRIATQQDVRVKDDDAYVPVCTARATPLLLLLEHIIIIICPMPNGMSFRQYSVHFLWMFIDVYQ